ncbi:ubiquitin-2 like Rad60 SUMO-like-domain-containing protein, partial [Aspergillus avenaceus]
MRSFFKRPSWATRGDENPKPDFYRRADQTYADIIAVNKEARDRSCSHVSNTSTEDDGKECKCRPVWHESGFETNLPLALLQAQERADWGSKSLSDNGLYRVSPTAFDFDGSNNLVERATMEIDTTDFSNAHPFGPKDARNPQPTHDESFLHPNKTKPITTGLSGRNDQGTYLDDTSHLDQDVDREGVDVIVQILITSKIETTEPLIIHRKISQPLRDVRIAWCRRQKIPKHVQPFVYLTWRGRRLFDVTTCRSLGSSFERSTTDGLICNDNPDKQYIRIHMEAVIEDLVPPTNGRDMPVRSITLNKQSATLNDGIQDEQTRVVLKCPAYGDLEWNFTPMMQISQLVLAFREAKDIPTDRTVYLIFDGDRLDPNSSIADYDIADEDLMDVVV